MDGSGFVQFAKALGYHSMRLLRFIRRNARIVFGVVLTTLIVAEWVVALVLVLLPDKAQGGKVDCPKTKKATAIRRTRGRRHAKARATRRAKSIKLVVSGTQPFGLAFEDSRGRRVLEVAFDAATPLPWRAGPIGAALTGDLQRTDHAASFPREQTRVVLKRSRLGKHLLAEVCLDPDQQMLVPPGRYTGTLRIEGTRVGETTASVVVTLRERRWWNVLLWSIGAALAGAMIKLITDVVKLEQIPENTTKNGKRRTRRPHIVFWHAFNLSFVLTLAVGLAATTAAFFAFYLRNPSFGTSSDDWGKLAAYCFGATVSGMTIADVGKKLPPA